MKDLMRFIKTDLEYGYEVRVFWGYDKKTDIYRNCITFLPNDTPAKTIEKLLKITAKRFIYSFNTQACIAEITLD
jgi:hypothetical protein